MQLVITSSKDTYITNKIIDNTYRSVNSNVGNAATLDLFKLYEESGLIENGSFITSGVTEKSVILIKFDYDKIGDLTSSILNFSDSNFQVNLELEDISSGLQKPFNFSALCSPLVNSFEEGFGMDVNGFNDLGSTNYLTSSFTTATATLWKSEGASAGGGSGQVKAVGSITVANQAGLDNTATFQLSDGTNTVVFTANVAANTPTRVNGTNFTFGINGAADNAAVADRIFAAIAAAKTGQNGTPDLNITATDPGDGAVINLRQDSFGPSGNTDIVLGGTAAGRLAFANLRGGYDTSHLDYFSSGSLDGDFVDFGSSYYFSKPNDNLIFDITTAVKAAVKGVIPNNGFRIGFSGSYDSENKTRFVKRFASRHVNNHLIVPKIRVFIDDELRDESNQAYLDKSFNLILKNKKGLELTNLINDSGASLINDNCGVVVISSGSYSKTVNFSQVNKSSNNTRMLGVYKASVTIPSNDNYIKKSLAANPEGFEVEVAWKSNDAAPITFKTEKIKIRGNSYKDFDISNLEVNFQNRKKEYSLNEDIDIICSAVYNYNDYSSSKKIQDIDTFQGGVFYEVSELVSKQKIIKLDFDNNSTKMGLEDGKFVSKIKSGTLMSGYSYTLQTFTKIGKSVFSIGESFTFGVI